MAGTIAAVCTSSRGGIPKYSQVVGIVEERGLRDDFHNRPERWSYGRRIWVPNTDRHLLVVAEEVKYFIAETKEIEGGKATLLRPGSFGENILVRGLGDLSNLVGGQMLAIRDGKILLRVVEQAEPCKNVRAAYGIEAYVALMKARGIYCAVHQGAGQQVSPNDSIELLGGGNVAEAEPSPKDKPTADAAKLEFETA